MSGRNDKSKKQEETQKDAKADDLVTIPEEQIAEEQAPKVQPQTEQKSKAKAKDEAKGIRHYAGRALAAVKPSPMVGSAMMAALMLVGALVVIFVWHSSTKAYDPNVKVRCTDTSHELRLSPGQTYMVTVIEAKYDSNGKLDRRSGVWYAPVLPGEEYGRDSEGQLYKKSFGILWDSESPIRFADEKGDRPKEDQTHKK